jgi:hypothetical protein
MQKSGRSWPISTNAARTDFNPSRHDAHGNGCALHQIEKFSRDVVRERKQEMLAAMMQRQCDVVFAPLVWRGQTMARFDEISAQKRYGENGTPRGSSTRVPSY